MKKAIVSLLIVLMFGTAAFATTEPAVIYDNINFAFQPTLARYNAMGQSGLALMTRTDSYYSNPAVLAKKGFALSVPSFAFTFYNLQKLVSDETAMAEFNRIIKGQSEDSDMTDFATRILNNLGTGYNTLAKMDFGLALNLSLLGLGTNVQLKIHSFNEGTSVASQTLIPEINVAQTIAVGAKIIDTSALSLSAGVSVHGVYKAYFKGIGGNKILTLIGNSEEAQKTIVWETPIMGGYAIPFDVGVTLGLLDDQISVSATANNLNGIYHMKSFQGFGYLVNSFSEGAIQGQPEGEVKESESFEVRTPWSLNFGFAFAPDVDVIHPVVTADLVDMFELCKTFGKETFRASDLLLHLNLGAEIGIFDIVTVKAGVNRGFMSVGAGIWTPVMSIDASYGWQEFGEELGDKPVDSFTIKFSLGYDKK